MDKEKIDSMIAVLQAYKEGEKIQKRSVCAPISEWEDCRKPDWDFLLNYYRVKPKPHYRPFECIDEVMEAIEKHGDWVKRTDGPAACFKIIAVTPDKVQVLGYNWTDYKSSFSTYKFINNTPFGKLVEEEYE